MKKPSSYSDFADSIISRLYEFEPLLYMTVSSELQQEAVDDLSKLKADLESEKKCSQSENYANLILGAECLASGVQAELGIWISLKQNEPEKAWDFLVEAQYEYGCAMRAHRAWYVPEARLSRLDQIEQICFPPQHYMSGGFEIEEMFCSICESDYESCSHVEGRQYNGQFCRLVITKCKLSEVSLVDSPKDKRCRVTRIKTEGGMRDLMTREITPQLEGDGDIEGIVARYC